MTRNPSTADPIPAVPPGVTLTTLDNGLTIIVREDHSAPVVSAQAWSMVGGLPHLIQAESWFPRSVSLTGSASTTAIQVKTPKTITALESSLGLGATVFCPLKCDGFIT